MKQNLQKTHYTAHNSADNTSDIEKFIDPQVLDTYDVYSYRHVAALFRTVHPNKLAEIEHALMNFSLTEKQIAYPGGNESFIPKFFSKELRPFGWNETRIQGDLVIKVFESNEKVSVQGKLLYRLNAGRHGGCPVLFFGITPKSIIA